MNRRQELLVVAGVALLVLVAAVLLLVRPKQQAVAEARADRDHALAERQVLGDQIRALETLQADEGELRTRARLARSEFPPTPNLPALVDALQDAAGRAGVDLETVSPSTPKASTVQPRLAQIDTSVSVSGGYFQIQDFLVQVEGLVKGGEPDQVPPRSVLVRSVNLTSAGTGDSAASTATESASPDELRATITLIVFQLAGSAGTPAASADATAAQGTQVR